ncbi:family 78 glycoside hydrolase catalytic domain [Demequina rhizosphaerae]|uniref:family 78 glycoside hydrolase catalytic domain n=1 Tax=Demequina rhizosphaerae TaxID=1638985 RepID=UPI0007849A69|nr:family 78 glycoside hydrolase catalytic domain [Demequina rhizosphaerae]
MSNRPPAAPDRAGGLHPVGLLANGVDRPLAVEEPRFSWVLEGEGHDLVQTAFRIVVRDEATGRTAWDSGEVGSSEQSHHPYDGAPLEPARPYAWTVAVRDGAGLWSAPSAPARFTTGVPADRWEADWIGPVAGEPGIDDDVYWWTGTDVDLGAGPIVAAHVHACAAHDYELHVDGARIGRGQSFDYPGESRYQGWDVTAAIRDGGIASLRMLARWYGNGQGRAAGAIGLIARLTVVRADGTTSVHGSDGSWRTAPTPYSGSMLRNCEGDFVEECDGRVPFHPDLAAGAPAHVIGRHPTPVFTRLVPELTPVAEEPAAPVAATVLEDGTTVLDFGRVIPARIAIDFAEGREGREVEITAAYSLAEDGHAATTVPATQETDMRFLYTQRDGAQHYRSLDHLGFRYLQIPPVGEPIGVAQVSATVVHAAPPAGRAATFSSSDPMLDAVVALMQRSALLGAQNQFVDTPTREKGQFLQDAVNISEATMTLLRERELTRKGIHQMLDSQDRYWSGEADAGRYNAVYPNGDGKRDIPDFSINMIWWVWAAYVQSGDRELLARAYPYLERTGGYIAGAIPASGPTAGLVTDLPGGKGPYLHGIVDWPAPGRFGYDMDTAVRTTVNALGVRAFATLARIAEVLGDDAARPGWEDRAAALRAAMNATLLADDGYSDGLKADGTRSGGRSQHATSHALACGVAPEERRGELAERVGRMGMRQGPMTAHLVIEALLDHGRAADALRVLTATDDLGWARLVAEGHSFTWEQWQPGQSESHAWGATAAVAVVERILGIRVEEPGGARLRLHPALDVLDEVAGTVHTERGPVSVRRTGNGLECEITVSLPPNVSATVVLPRVGNHVPTDGLGAAPVPLEESSCLVEVGSGRRSFRFAPAAERA